MLKYKDSLTKVLENAFMRSRSTDKSAASDTTFLCYAARNLCFGNKIERELGVRVIRSIFRRRNISTRFTENFLYRIAGMHYRRLAEFLLELQPYIEMKKVLEADL